MQPFNLYLRNGVYYVRFKSEETGKYLSGISTGETSFKQAEKTAYKMLIDGHNVQQKTFCETVRKYEFTNDEVLALLTKFQKAGFITGYKLDTGERINAFQFALDFWNPEKSQYLKEKARKKHEVHSRHLNNSVAYLYNYWYDIIIDKNLNDITRKDLNLMFDKLEHVRLSGNTKNHVMHAFTTPLKWAYTNELIDRDITQNLIMFSAEYKKREILTKEMARAIFNVQWENDMSKLASKVSMLTGMRAGEILALKLHDIGEDCIYVRHSWNQEDGLKKPKNGEERTVMLPFPDVIFELLKMGNSNPYGEDGFIFYGLTPDKPVDQKILRKYFRRALMEIGLTEKESRKYTFHSWRHFYSTYMLDRVNQRALQFQTGHKTAEMLEHYADHVRNTDYEQIKLAQIDVFSNLLT